MKKTNTLMRKSAEVVARIAKSTASNSANSLCIIYYQDEMPESVKKLNKFK